MCNEVVRSSGPRPKWADFRSRAPTSPCLGESEVQLDRNSPNDKVCSLSGSLSIAPGNMPLLMSCGRPRLHDETNTGTISYGEFEKLHGFLTHMAQSFQYFDQDQGGTLSPDEVYRAIQHAGESLVQGPHRSYCKNFCKLESD